MNGPQFWLDDVDALDRIAIADVSDEIKGIARDLATEGIAVLRGANSPDLCKHVIADYGRYVELHRDYVRGNLTEHGREKRLVNFHLWSEPAAQLASNPRIMAALDFVFASPAAVYTSLTFKYGTQQPVHRDTPHFATWPLRMFAGVWTALEDVSPDAGPLFYHPGSHRLAIDPAQYMAEARSRIPDGSERDQLLMALDLYNGEVIRRSTSASAPKILDLRAGDTVIWHPELPHGGSPANNPDLTRWSSVFHCAPVAVQVHQHDRFFLHAGETPPPDRYGYFERFGRHFAVSGEVAYM
ncbi:MAG: phytanoyl-CoA dioxygenase family protein [Rubrivivax sp.]|nr:phytanoyl-CoA dioxygenase family protein [Rubrivivax sp.]